MIRYVFLSLAIAILLIQYSGCSMAYKPDIHDSTINHQSGNKPSTDVNLDLRRK